MAKMNMNFDPSFFQEEMRSGYKVSSDTKKIWAVELDLLNELLRVCKKHHIRIMASGGTMLGAVRHGGFIPWDDDIDMMMERTEYDKLCSIAKQEFHYPYFFQTEYTDPGSLRGHAQLRNSSTTAALLSEKETAAFNQGVFLDIFPLDSVIDNPLKLKFQSMGAKFCKKMAQRLYCLTEGYSRVHHTPKRKFFHAAALVLNKFCSYNKWYSRFEKICAEYDNINTQKFSSLSFMFDEITHHKYRKDYERLIEMPFEMLRIPVGSEYEHALSLRYGDWKKEVIGSSCHNDILFDTDKSYRNLIFSENQTEKEV